MVMVTSEYAIFARIIFQEFTGITPDVIVPFLGK